MAKKSVEENEISVWNPAHPEYFNEKNLEFQEIEVRRSENPIIEEVPGGRKLTWTFERLKVKRPRVLINRKTAAVLNDGPVQQLVNNFFSAYLLPDEELEPFIKFVKDK